MGIVNESDLEWSELEHGQTRFERKQLGAAAGGEELGCSLYELPPEYNAWPYHYHTGNEEAIYVLEGTGSIRLDGEMYDLEAGDYAALPADESGAHKVINDSDGPLRYLSLSTMNEPDLSVYPDSGKMGVYAGVPPGGHGERSLEGYYRIGDDVDYWEGE